jgi:hypothetical protein
MSAVDKSEHIPSITPLYQQRPQHYTLHRILDIYQACRARGEFARVILEAKDGKEMVTFYSCEKGYPTPANRVDNPSKKKKSPSDIARNRRRREAWLKA